jgi:predicted amidohydrolase
MTAPVAVLAAALAATPSPTGHPLPDGWAAAAPRDEIRPAIGYDPHAGPGGTGAFVLAAAGPEQHGWVEKAFPVEGGTTYRFHARRRTDGVAVPRRSGPARIVWLDAAGRQVPAAAAAGPGPVPTAEPEHPLDGPPGPDGWTPVAGAYRAPPRAVRAVVELHLQWAAGGRAAWADVSFAAVPPPPPRKVRLAAVHFKPSGKSPRANCEEYAPLLAEAARQRADLAVLGETVPYVNVGKKPHEAAEPVPGPTTEYFGGLAKAHGLYVVLSVYERDGRAVYNTAVLLGPDARLVGKYRKVCLPHAEAAAGVTPGGEYPVFDTRFGKVGLMVCYDGFFPEVARALAANGAEVIAWPVWGCDPLLARARANENRVFVASSTYTDAKDGWMLSAVYDRDGTPLARGERWGTVAVAEVDLGEPRVGPYNLGAFHDMAQRHRPEPPAGRR